MIISQREIDSNFVLLVISAIFSLIGAILMLATSYAGYGGYYTYAIWADDAVLGPIIIISAIFLFICMGISLIGLKDISLLDNRINYALLVAAAALILNLIGIGVTFAYLIEVDWWPGAGMIGGTIASIIATVVFFVVRMNTK